MTEQWMTGRPRPQPLLGSGTAATAEATTEGGSELAGGTTLLALLTAAVATLTRSTGTTLTVLTAHHAARGSVGALLLDVGGGDNLGGEVQPLAQVVKTLGGEGVVVVLPRELGLDVAAGVQRLASLDDLYSRHILVSNPHEGARFMQAVRAYIEVLGVDVTVLGKVEVLLGHEHTLCERKSVNCSVPSQSISWRQHL